MRTLRESAAGIVVACLFFYGCGATLLADGCYVPDRVVRKLPEIPTQRALLCWKDGTETLMISSTLDSEAQKLGWLIPLPSVPREMAKADPGALKTLAFCVQPRITHDLIPEVFAVTLLIGWLAFGAVIATFRKESLIGFIVWSLVLLVLGAMLLPALNKAGGTAIAKINVERTAKVGAYEISVLKAGGPTELNRWLAENGFTSLPPAAEPMVADYVRRGWVFAAIKLTRAEQGSSTPHPVKLVFSAQEAVYPWKLTTLAGGQSLLELFVVGPSRAKAGKLKTEFCQRLRTESGWRFKLGSGWSGPGIFDAEQVGVAIGHPEIVPLLWDGCVLTKLSGYLNARRQTDDLPVRWTGFEPYQQHFYTTAGARSIAWMLFVGVLGIICVPGLILCRTPNGERFYFGRLLPRTMLAAVLIAGVTYLCLPKLRGSEFQVGWTEHSFPFKVSASIGMILQPDENLRQKDEDAIAQEIVRRLHLPNLLIGGEVCAEISPGNFTIEKRDGKVVVRVYDRTGLPSQVEAYPDPDLKIFR